jgi:2'-5' RNA ligase
MKRVFIALNVTAEGDLLRMISSLKALLGSERIRWVDTSKMHITLAFLGDTEEDRIRIISRMLKEKCSGFSTFEFVLAGTGVFKSLRNPQVIWAGIEESEKLLLLYRNIAEGLNSIGIRTEERELKPHLTLGRLRTIRDTQNFKSVLESYNGKRIQTVNVSNVILYESILMPSGPLYRSLGNHILQS